MRRVLVILISLLFSFQVFAASVACQGPLHVSQQEHVTSSSFASTDFQALIELDAAAQCDDDSNEPPASADIDDSLHHKIQENDGKLLSSAQLVYVLPLVDLPFLPRIKPPPHI